jgi:2-polyprenyl-3-methyl-5-hydroxy-6-metoxy-1,4-benzoquinol methylase
MATLAVTVNDDELSAIYQRTYFNNSTTCDVGYTGYDSSADSDEEFALACRILCERLPRGCKVLEVGCATGGFLDLLRAAAFHSVGVELSAWAADQAAARGHIVNVCAFADYKCAPETFDAIVSLEVIEHARDPRAFVRQARALLKRGGLFVLGTPNFARYYKVGAAYRGLSHSLEHLHYFDQNSLTHLLASEGFQVVVARTCNPEDRLAAFAGRSVAGRSAFQGWCLLKRVMPGIMPAYRRVRRVLSDNLRERDARKSLGQTLLVGAEKTF